MTPAGKSRHCLIAEDEALLAMHLEDLLCDFGFQVTVANSLEAALEQASSGCFDCAVLDVNLNAKHSFPVADLLLARGIPFATGYGADGVEARFRGSPVLQKPFSDADLRKLVSAL